MKKTKYSRQDFSRKKLENIPIVELIDESQLANVDITQTLFNLDSNIDMLSSHADNIDYFVSIASGLLSAMLDILWVGDFDISKGRKISEKQTKSFVVKIAKILGYKGNDVNGAVKYLENKYPIPADGNTTDFGGGLQHHLRDFAHHPTIVGLIFSLMTQFTEHSYGTDTSGIFIVVPVPEKSKIFIGKDISDKIFKGTIIWFFHLISDVAGSSSTAGLNGGTGIPGPILSLVKEISALPFMKNVKANDMSLSEVLSKLFNGTLFAHRDNNGKVILESIVKMDFRGELGIVNELGKQAVSVVANDCIVRTFYFIRRFAIELKQKEIRGIYDLKNIEVDKIVPYGNPTIDRMLLVATGVFTTIDISEAVITQKYFISVNYVGVGRFAVAIGKETANYLKVRNLKEIKRMYELIDKNTYTSINNNIYRRMDVMNESRFGLTMEQVEILYNLEYQKTLNDIKNTGAILGNDSIKNLKLEWVEEWKKYIELGFPKFVEKEDARLVWYDRIELLNKIKELGANDRWYKLVLLEAMIFEPYYPISTEKNNKGEDVPSKKYSIINNPVNGYKKTIGDKYLDDVFVIDENNAGFITRLRKTYDKSINELTGNLKKTITLLSIVAASTIVAVITAGIFAGPIAVALVGSEFAGLSGAALTSACLAYIGGGAIAAGGAGMIGGAVAVVGGGALLGVGVGTGVGTIATNVGDMGKLIVILQSAKLTVSMKEIFLNDEKDIEYSNAIYQNYVNNIRDLEYKISELKLKENVANGEEKKKLTKEIKNLEDSVNAMSIAMKSMNRFKSAFEEGMNAMDSEI